MRGSPTETALTALTDWWDGMGVDVASEEVAALLKAAPAREMPVAPPQTAAPSAGAAPVPGLVPVKRAGKKSVTDWVADAESLAAGAGTLDELKTIIEAFEGCPLKAGANKTVVFDGVQGASVMVIGEGAGGTEDRVGVPFVGKAGQLLDRMLAAIGLDRKTNTFITNVTYWRPPGNRNPEADELEGDY